MSNLLLAVPASLVFIMAVPGSSATTNPENSQAWMIENARLRVTVDPAAGRIAVHDKTSGHVWRQPEDKAETVATTAPRFRNVHKAAGHPDGVTFEADFGTTNGKPNTLIVTLTVPGASGRLVILSDKADRAAAFAGCDFLDPFILDAADGVIVAADYCDGHMYPLDMEEFPRRSVLMTSLEWFPTDRLDMPWVGLCDLRTGLGYSLIVDTSDDAAVACGKYRVGRRRLFAPHVVWRPSKGTFAYARRVVYCFTAEGGYVALAKAYRAHMREQGLLVTLADKMRKNPNVARLLGAVNVWDVSDFALVEEAKALGIDKMLIQCGLERRKAPPQRITTANGLGYLTCEYDCYTDMLPEDEDWEMESLRGVVPDHVVLNAHGERVRGWIDLKERQYMKRCARFWVPKAQSVIPKVLSTHPYTARFIDVTTSTGLYECYDERHPLTRSDKRECGVDLLRYTRSQGLVVGGEHGIWWAVPHLDWIEGMMSGPYYPWPAGYLMRPKTREQKFTTPIRKNLASWSDYETWNLGHAGRVPLWELVFHDCVVSTWYWGDTNDWLLEAAPELTAKKDAFNILYGTVPMLWANQEGSWHRARDVFLRTYRNTCKLHEVVGALEMMSHAFVTPDRAVQRTRFADGTEVIVNFGVEPHAAELAGRQYALPQNGFAVKGPRIEQSLVLVADKAVTTIRTEGYLFTDAGGVGVTLRRFGENHLRINIDGAGPRVTVRPADAASNWDVARTRVFKLDIEGKRLGEVPFSPIGDDGIAIGPFTERTILGVVCRSRASQ